MELEELLARMPNINYNEWQNSWLISVGQQNIYNNIRMRPYIQFEGNLLQCEDHIINLINEPGQDNAAKLQIFDLIMAWGGRSARTFYVRRNEGIPRVILNGNRNLNTYLHGIDLAQQGSIECINVFANVYGIGPSFASKHAYFWSLNSDNRMIIVDSKIAGGLGFNNLNMLYGGTEYQTILNAFSLKAQEKFQNNNRVLVERAIFTFYKNFFKNDNSGWIRPVDQLRNDLDFHIALQLSYLLFGYIEN